MYIDVILGDSSFSSIDFAVVGISLGIVLICGLYHVAFTSRTPEDFLVGGRSMRTTPVAVSTAMLYISALAIIDSPTEIYYYGIETFMASLVTVAVVPLSAFMFVPMFHKMQLTSVHQYIGHRFDSTVLRCMTSLTFILQQTFLTCIILSLVGTALERHFELPTLTSVISIGVFAAVNSSLGGFKATVWTQLFQFFWITAFLTFLVVVGITKAGGFLQAFNLAAEHGRLKLFNFEVDPFMRHNFYNFVLGYGFTTLMEMATCQPIVQRYLSLPTRKDAMKSVFMGIPLHIVPSVLFLMFGILLQAAYAGCDPLVMKQILRPEDLVPYFVSKNLTSVPGINGVFAACIIGGAISMFCTSVNSMTACAYQDFVSKLGCCKASEAKSETTCCSFISFGFSALCTILTCLAIAFSYVEKGELFSTTSALLTVNAVLYGPLAAVFIMAMFFPCVNKYGASVGFLGGVISMGFLAIKILMASNTSVVAPLPAILGNCPDALGTNYTFLSFMPWHPKTGDLADAENMQLKVEDVQYVSYLLLTLLGATLTVGIGFPISILTGGLCVCAARKVPASLLHPMLSFSDCCIDSEERQLRHAISHRYVDRIASVHNLFPSSANRLDSKPPSYKYSSVPGSPESVVSY